MEVRRRALEVVGAAGWSRQARFLLAQLLVALVPVGLFTVFHPFPLTHPDPVEFGRVVRTMLAEGSLLVSWDPPLRYFLQFDLALLAGGSASLVDRIGVFQAAVYSYLLVVLAVYGLFSTARGPAAGLAAAVVVTIARVARLPPTGVVWHHWQVGVGYTFALAAVALAVGTVRANERGRERLEIGYAALTAITCGLALNAEPWIALFATVGITCAWASHLAVRALVVAGLLGVVAGAPVLLVPQWEVHLAFFVVSVVEPYGPLFSVDALVSGILTPGTLGVVALFGTGILLWRRGTPLPGEWVVGFAVLAGFVPWALFQVTTLSGVGVRGLYWSLLVGIPAVAIQAGLHVPEDHLVGRMYRELFFDLDPGAWAALLVAEAGLLAFSVGLFVATYGPPS
jgi:hypothetical protein